MEKRINPYFIICLVTFTSTFALWLPFLTHRQAIGFLQVPGSLSMLDLYRHWDGALYVLVAKSWYDPNSWLLKQFPLGLSPQYFTAHFPLYPALIALLAPLIGYLKSMLVWPVLFAAGYACLFYYFVKQFKLTAKPLLLTLVALFFTPRFFVIRSAPAPETIFMFLILLSMTLFMKKRYFWASLVAAVSVWLRSPGLLLFIGYGLYFLTRIFKERKINWSVIWLGLGPISFGLLFGFFYLQTNDFWAYFHSGDNLHLLFPPFQVFNQKALWVGTGWLEDVLIIFFFYLLVLFQLWEKPKQRPIFYFVLVYFLAIISIQHRDIGRYSLGMLPFGLIAFEQFFTDKKVVLAGLILLPAWYFYAWNFLLHNVAPITQWQLFQ